MYGTASTTELKMWFRRHNGAFKDAFETPTKKGFAMKAYIQKDFALVSHRDMPEDSTRSVTSKNSGKETPIRLKERTTPKKTPKKTF